MSWHAFVTKPMREFRARESLAQIGVTVFVPEERRIQRRNRFQRRQEAVTRPMLPRYLFARLEYADDWPEILGNSHICGVVGFAGVPARVPDWEIQKLAAASGALMRANSVHRGLAPGDLARVTGGSYREHVVPVLQIDGPKARILVTLFGSAMEATIGLEHLEAA